MTEVFAKKHHLFGKFPRKYMEFIDEKAAGPAGGFRGYQVSSGKAYLARYPAKHSTKAVTAEEGHALEQIHCIGFLLMKCAQLWPQLHDRSVFPFFQLNFRQRNGINGVF